MSGGDMTPVIKNLLIINGLVFMAQLVLDKQGFDFTDYGMLYDWGSDKFRVWQVITHMFLHTPENFMHIFFNMLLLYMFGTRLEYHWGAKRFLQFYLICGIAAAITQMLIQDNFKAYGASGAVMGVLTAFTYLFPNERLMIFPIFIPVKVKYIVPALIAMDLFSGIADTPGDDVGHWAHLGGALAGFVIVWFWNKTNRRKFY
jgi:membrane associated rhomboid family serine protease